MTSYLKEEQHIFFCTKSTMSVFRIRPCGTIFSNVDFSRCRLSASNVKSVCRTKPSIGFYKKSLVSFAGMTLDKCIVLRIGTLTGCPLCRESHPLCRLKNPTSNYICVCVCGSSVVRHLPLVLEVPGSIPARGQENFGIRTRFP